MFDMTPYLLSPLETAILRWLSRGRSMSEIAALEGKSVLEIELCLNNALASLGTGSIREALVKAGLPEAD